MTAETIPAVVDDAARRFGAAEALVDGDLRLSFVELKERVDEAARAFVAAGLEPGDRVAIWASNSAEWAIAALAAYRAGGIVVTLNTRFKASEARDILERSRTRILLTEVGFLDTDFLGQLGDPPDCVEEVVVLRGCPDHRGHVVRCVPRPGRRGRARRRGGTRPCDRRR